MRMAAKGRPQTGKTGTFDPGKTIRGSIPLAPGAPERRWYEELIRDLGCSGAEVLRRGLQDLYEKHKDAAPAEARIAS